MDESAPLLFERDGNVAIISFNRPEKLNAVGRTTLADLNKMGDECAADPAIHAVVLTGRGRAFCAGADLSPEAQSSLPVHTAPMRTRFPIREDTGWPDGWFGFNIPKPVICAVNGAAVGWGAEVLATCDMRVAGESGRIGWVFARRGLVADMGAGPIILPRLIGLSQTARLLYSGEVIGAQEALRIGLVDEVVPDDQLLTRAVELARHLAGGAPNAIAVHKRQIHELLRRDPHEVYFESLDEFEKAMKSEDFKEGARAFMEKRPPAWASR